MPTEKLADIPRSPTGIACHDQDHNPPSNYVFQPGVYKHECRNCHFVQVFMVKTPSTL